jgi:hypothetical protein
MADLVERNRAAVPAHQREVRQTPRIQPLSAGAARHDGDIADVLADLRYRDACEEELELPAYLGWRKADEVQSILIRDEAEYGRAISSDLPFALDVPAFLAALAGLRSERIGKSSYALCLKSVLNGT